MPQDYWHRQTASKPLYPELIWSRPENRAFAGKLMIAGGHAHGFAVPAEAYQAAMKAGAGSIRALLPDALQKSLGRTFEAGEFAPSTPSGSFSRKALAAFLDCAAWADGVLLAGELGRNSETAILLESFSRMYRGQLTITRDAADYFTAAPLAILERPETMLVISSAQLQKLFINSRQTTAITFDMDLLRLVDALHAFTLQYPTHLIVKHGSNRIVAVDGTISTTKWTTEKKIWRVQTAAAASVWWLQNPARPMQAITTSLVA